MSADTGSNGFHLPDTPEVSPPEVTALAADLEALSLEDLLRLRPFLESLIQTKREARIDYRLELAVLELAERGKGGTAGEGHGFNAWDAHFGYWLAAQIQSGAPLLRWHAQAALEMVQSYPDQLATAGPGLPDWADIAHQYPPAAPPPNPDMALPAKRTELQGDRLCVYTLFDETGEFQRLAKSILGYKFERNPEPHWHFPAERVAEVLSAYPASDGYVIEPAVEGVWLHQAGREAAAQVQREAEAERSAQETLGLIATAEVDEPLPGGLTLYEHQKRGVEWLLAHRQGGLYPGGILADDMGLGKTLEALVAARALTQTHDSARILVVCPASLRENWAREAERVEMEIETRSWAKMPQPLEGRPYVVIADEAHYAQSLKSKRTQALLSLVNHENCLAAWLLTGTPLKNGRPVNLYPLLLASGHPLGRDQRGYETRYCAGFHRDVGRGRMAWDTTGAAHLDELAVKSQDVILRRTKDECLDLPPKIRTHRPADLTAKELLSYNAHIEDLVADYRRRAGAGEVDPAAEALVTLNILRQVGSQYKVATAVEMAEQLLEQGQPVVLFTEFVESARALHEGLGGELLTGKSKAADRQAMVDRFQSGESPVFVGTVKAGGVGLTLTASSYVILVDRPWTPGDTAQAEDRCHRIGAEHTVHSFWLTLGAIDEAIDQLIEAKSKRVELVLKGKRKTLRGVQSRREFARELLELL